MKRQYSIPILSVIALAFLFAFFIRLNPSFIRADQIALAGTPEMADVVDQVLESRRLALEESDSGVDFAGESEINVLVLGLDARKGHKEPHCDAIHMFTLNIEDWTVTVTSVPRGTYAYIPPGTYADNQYYISNACAFAGLDYGIEQIERVLGVKADYVATAGFSQVIGVLRFFDLPTTEGLQWLRHRQSYAIGDPQRSHNQAVFMKDMIIGQADKLRTNFSVPMQFVLYNIVETDMDFGTARALIKGYLESEIDKRPDDIVLKMKPWFPVSDYHFDVDNPEDQLQQLMDYIAPYLSEEDLSGRTLESIQTDLDNYLERQLTSKESVEDINEKRLWLQLEDGERREYFQFEYMKNSLEDLEQDQIKEILSEYILEKETLGIGEWAKKGKELLRENM